MFGMRTLVLLLLCVVGPVLGHQNALAPPAQPLNLLDIGAPSFTNFSPRDGLPTAVTVAIRTDRDGFVWVASPAGVFRYDGRRWVASDDPAMAHSVDDLFIDRQGTLWTAFRSHGLARYDGTRWHVEDTSTGLPSQQIRRFAESVDANGVSTLWALTWDQGLMFLSDGHWHPDPDNASLPRGPCCRWRRPGKTAWPSWDAYVHRHPTNAPGSTRARLKIRVNSFLNSTPR